MRRDAAFDRASPRRRTTRCRRAPASRLRRSRPRGRPTCPSTACRAAGPRPGTPSNSARRIRNCARAATTSRRRLGDAHEAAQRKPRQRGDAPARARAHPRAATPLLVASPLMLTWTQTLSGRRFGRSRRRQPLARCAAGRRVCTQAKRAAAARRLVALERPDQVPFDVRQVGERVHLGQRLLHVVLAERALARARRPRGSPRREASC